MPRDKYNNNFIYTPKKIPDTPSTTCFSHPFFDSRFLFPSFSLSPSSPLRLSLLSSLFSRSILVCIFPTNPIL